MGTRELVILILGLAVLAVILRGLMVAIKARRGQLKMAIEKNIPKDVDLDALEMAELPNGGARVVARSLDHVNRQNAKSVLQAQKLRRNEARAQKLDLGGAAAKAGPIPVMMDSVAVVMPAAPQPAQPAQPAQSAQTAQSAQSAQPAQSGRVTPVPVVPAKQEPAPMVAARDDFDHIEEDEDLVDGYDDDDIEDDDNFDDVGDVDEFEDDELDDDIEDADDEFDPLGDDVEDDDVEDDDLDIDDDDDDDFDDFDDDDDDDVEDVFPKDDYFDDDEDYDYNRAAATGKPPLTKTEPSFEDSLGSFSMTAGERIGTETEGRREPGAQPRQDAAKSAVAQASLFDDEAPSAPAVDRPLAEKKPSLLKRIGDKARAYAEHDDAGTDEVPVQPTPVVQKVFPAKPVEPRRQEARVSRKPAETTDFKAAREAREQKSEPPRAVEPSEVLVVNVMSREGRMFHGDDLLQALITTGLKFGEMNIFHHRLNNRNDGPVIFSVANILNPGTFDLNRMGEFTTRGVSLFLAMPAAINNMEAFDAMLKTALQIKGALDGELKDDHRNVMTAQTVEHYRQRIRDYELRRLKAAQA